MKVALVGEMAPALKGGGKSSESQVNAGGFDMAMAAVMALLMPNPNESTPAQYQSDGELVFSEEIAGISAENMLSLETDDLMPQQSMLLGPLAIDALAEAGKQARPVKAGDEQLLPQQMAQTPKNAFPPISVHLMAEAMPAEKQAGTAAAKAAEGTVKVLENIEVQQAVAQPDRVIKDARTVNINAAPSPLFAETLSEAGFIPEKQEKVLLGAAKNNSVVVEEDSARAAPSVSGSNVEKAASVNSLAGTLTLGANAQAASAKVITGAEVGQTRSTGEVVRAEGKENVNLVGKIEAGGTASAGETKNESSGFNNFSGDTFQPDSSQLSNAVALSSYTKDLKGVALPALKDVLVQEIKYFCDTRKGEPTQLQITLEPESLGKLTIKLFYNNGELNAHFYAVNDHVRGVLESSMQQLRENLGQQDLILNQAFVSVGDENSGGTGSQMEFGSRQMEYQPDKNSGPFYQQSKMEPDGYDRTGNDSTQVNYLI